VCVPYFVNLNNNTFQLKTLLFFVHLHSQQKRTDKDISNYLFEVFRALVRSVDVGLILLALYQVPHSVNVLSNARTSTTGCSFNGPVVRNRFWKSSTLRLLHFLFVNSLINRFTVQFFDSQTFFINVLSSLWSPYVIGQTIIFLPCDFYLLLLSFFLSSPNLSRRTLDVYHTSTHGVALVRI